jgi:Ca2+-binding RTX toxin-like protein
MPVVREYGGLIALGDSDPDSSVVVSDPNPLEDAPDATPPVLISLSPEDGARRIPVDSNFVLTFDEPVFAGTGTVAINYFLGGLTQGFSITSASVTFSGNTVTINPPVDLHAVEAYYITISSTAIVDAAGNAFEGIHLGDWDFNAENPEDAMALKFLHGNPSDGSQNLSPSSDFDLTFNRSMQVGTGLIEIRNGATGKLYRVIDISDTNQVTIDAGRVTIEPAGGFGRSSDYYFLLRSGVLEDEFGNNFVGISTSTKYNFSIAPQDNLSDFSSDTSGFDANLNSGTASGPGIGVVSIAGDANLIGGSGNDRFEGDALANSFEGGDGDDTLIGGDGNDFLDGGPGVDSLYGGNSDDVYYVDGQWDLVFESPGEGLDAVVSTASFYLYDDIEVLFLENGAGNIFGVGNALDNTMFGNEGDNLLIGWDGNDTIYGGGGNDILYGVNGADLLFGEAGIDVLIGGDGDDYLDGGDNPDEIYGQDGNDVLTGGAGFHTDILVGGDGNDILNGSAPSTNGVFFNLGDYDLLYGGMGDDTYYVDTPDDLTFEFNGLAEGNDTVIADIEGAGYYLYGSVENLILLDVTPFGVGNELDNELTGSEAANWLLGGAGNDRINGEEGDDILFGETGSDTFVFEPGTGADLISDFDKAEDKIELMGTAFNSFADLTQNNNLFETGGSSVIDLGGGDLVVISGVTGLSMANFLFS